MLMFEVCKLPIMFRLYAKFQIAQVSERKNGLSRPCKPSSYSSNGNSPHNGFVKSISEPVLLGSGVYELGESR